MFNNFFSKNRAVYEIMSKNEAESERAQMTRWRRVACWIIKATGAQAEAYAHAPSHTQNYVILFLRFHYNNGYVNAPQCYVMRTLPVLFIMQMNYKLRNVHRIRAAG